MRSTERCQFKKLFCTLFAMKACEICVRWNMLKNRAKGSAKSNKIVKVADTYVAEFVVLKVCLDKYSKVTLD